jgi:hypothetical protein
MAQSRPYGGNLSVLATRIGGMDRQTLRDCVIRFNEGGANAFPFNFAGGRA